MNGGFFVVVLVACLQLTGASVLAQYPEAPETGCSGDASSKEKQSGICSDPDSTPAAAVPESSLQLLFQFKNTTDTKARFRDDDARTRPCAPGQSHTLEQRVGLVPDFGGDCGNLVNPIIELHGAVQNSPVTQYIQRGQLPDTRQQ